MREILFRGKQRTMLDWVEGTGVFNDGTNTWLSANESNKPIACGLNHKIVLSETVGQYTGLTDKNGKKIFEGDIAKNEYEDRKCQYFKIFYNEKTLQWEVMNKYGMRGNLHNVIGSMEVIGNIHDNPELLGGEGDGN